MSRRRWRNSADGELLDACRAGETEAFSYLWERHRRAALTAAWGIAPGLDAEDLVSDAYLKIYQLVVDGRGPRGAFRPYLYQTIRTAAADQLRSREHTVGEFDQLAELVEAGPDDEARFDLDTVKLAFAALDERRQAALWYAEVEGLPPRKAASLLGLSANATAVLTKRAREALRSAWVEAHASHAPAEAECREMLAQLQRFQRGRLTAGVRRKVEAHLADCASCTAVAADFSAMNRRLGLILAGTVLGGVGLAPLLSQLGLGSGTAYAAALVGGTAEAVSAGAAGGAGSVAAAAGAAGTASASAGSAVAVATGATAATTAAGLGAGGAFGGLLGAVSAATVTVSAVALTASGVFTPALLPDTAKAAPGVVAERVARTAQPAQRDEAGPSHPERAGERDRPNQRDQSPRQERRDRERTKQADRGTGPEQRSSKQKRSQQSSAQKKQKSKKPQPKPDAPATKPKKQNPSQKPSAAERGGSSAARG